MQVYLGTNYLVNLYQGVINFQKGPKNKCTSEELVRIVKILERFSCIEACSKLKILHYEPPTKNGRIHSVQITPGVRLLFTETEPNQIIIVDIQ